MRKGLNAALSSGEYRVVGDRVVGEGRGIAPATNNGWKLNPRMSPRNRINRTTNAVLAGVTEGTNIRVGLAAGRDWFEKQKGEEPELWAPEPMTFTGTRGELSSAMAFGALENALMFRVAAQNTGKSRQLN
jgi:hypothetical protein